VERRPRPDLDSVRDALRERDERPEDPEPRTDEPTDDEDTDDDG
jgi:hypothetical protein